MSQEQPAPLIKLEENGAAPVLRYDVPEPTSYRGANLIELEFDDPKEVYLDSLFETDAVPQQSSLVGQPTETIKTKVKSFLTYGISQNFELGQSRPLGVGTIIPPPGDDIEEPDDDSINVRDLILDDIADKLQKGERLVLTDNLHGDENVTTVPVPPEPDPHIYLVETISMTSFLGDYGAGRVVKTFTLLPGEDTKISIKTFKQRESTRKQTTSVLDSFTTESADDLQTSLEQEQSDQRSFKKSFEYYADVKAKARWGWGSASAKAGLKGASNSSREESVKNISKAVESHTSKASAKREIDIDTAYEVTEKEGEEMSIERQLENINLSRTLNFVFRQMNQAFISFIHLTDVRIGYFDGRRESRIEVPISALDRLLNQVVKPAAIADTRDIILEQLRGVRDHLGAERNVLRTINAGTADEYIQFDTSIEDAFFDKDTKTKYEIPGILLAVNRHVMRTEGMIVEAILGEGIALDKYATRLQELEVERKEIEIQEMQANVDQQSLLNEIASDGDADKAEILAKLLCPCGNEKSAGGAAEDPQ